MAIAVSLGPSLFRSASSPRLLQRAPFSVGDAITELGALTHQHDFLGGGHFFVLLYRCEVQVAETPSALFTSVSPGP